MLARARRPCGAQKNVLPTRVRVVLEIVQTSQRITTLRATVAKLGGPITIRPRSQPRRGTLSAHPRHGVTVPTRPLPRQSASAVGDRVATRREIIVGSVLILIRASLIALTRRLIVIRPRLILIALLRAPTRCSAAPPDGVRRDARAVVKRDRRN